MDTNILVRSAMHDDRAQAATADRLLKRAAKIVVTLPCLCEFVWVLRSIYGLKHDAIAFALRTLLAAANVEVDRSVVDAGLAMLDSGGDFADGVIAYEGHLRGGEAFVSFDRRAVKRLLNQGVAARLLA